MYYVYIISIPERAKKNIYKIGKHKGSKNRLYNRYKNSLINPKIYLFIKVNNYTRIESLIKKKLDKQRILFKEGTKSEWVKLELSKIINCFNNVLKYDDKENVIKIDTEREDNENLERDCLLKNTDIQCDAIDIYCDIYSKVYYDNGFSINIDIVAKLFKNRKDHLKRTLIKYFKKNIDFTIDILKIKNIKGNGTHFYHNINLTLNCFKELCIFSAAPRSKEIRKEYIQVEKILNEYYDAITTFN